MRELKVGFQCEYVDVRFGERTRCQAKHNDRSQGAPKQLVPVKEGKTIRFLCTDHAKFFQSGGAARPRQKKSPPGEEQMRLV